MPCAIESRWLHDFAICHLFVARLRCNSYLDCLSQSFSCFFRCCVLWCSAFVAFEGSFHRHNGEIRSFYLFQFRSIFVYSLSAFTRWNVHKNWTMCRKKVTSTIDAGTETRKKQQQAFAVVVHCDRSESMNRKQLRVDEHEQLFFRRYSTKIFDPSITWPPFHCFYILPMCALRRVLGTSTSLPIFRISFFHFFAFSQELQFPLGWIEYFCSSRAEPDLRHESYEPCGCRHQRWMSVFASNWVVRKERNANAWIGATIRFIDFANSISLRT